MLRFGLLVIAALLFFATPALAQSSQTVTVERVVDGDTIEVNPAVGGTQDVRLLGVDTPETVDPTEPVWPDPVFCTRCYESVSTDSSSSGFPPSSTLLSRSVASANCAGVR